MRFIFWVFFTLMPLFASAQSSMFAGYDAFCGLPVIVESTSQDAVATIRNNMRIIIVDPGVMSNWKFSRMFALAHECGHHVLGHLSLQERFSRSHMNATARQEISADCWAAKVLAANGYYGEIERAIRDNDGQGPMMNGPYPSGTTRAAYIGQCAGIGPGVVRSTGGENPNPRCLAQMNQRCMTSCQRDFGHSYSVCENRMCNSPRQLESDISRCAR